MIVWLWLSFALQSCQPIPSFRIFVLCMCVCLCNFFFQRCFVLFSPASNWTNGAPQPYKRQEKKKTKQKKLHIIAQGVNIKCWCWCMQEILYIVRWTRIGQFSILCVCVGHDTNWSPLVTQTCKQAKPIFCSSPYLFVVWLLIRSVDFISIMSLHISL